MSAMESLEISNAGDNLDDRDAIGFEFGNSGDGIVKSWDEEQRGRRNRRRVVVGLLAALVVVVAVVTVSRQTKSDPSLAVPDSEQEKDIETEPEQVGGNEGTNTVSTPVTSAPTPATASATSPAPSTLCTGVYDCQDEHPDRLGHFARLYAGNAVCNDLYRFGLTQSGVFQFEDCSTGQVQVFYDGSNDYPPPSSSASDVVGGDRNWGDASPLFFVMTDKATLQVVLDNDRQAQQHQSGVADKVGSDGNSSTTTVVWEKATHGCPVNPSPHCLSNPLLDCPYIHLHKSGDVVLNWISDDGPWLTSSMQKRCYDGLFPSSG